MLANLLGSPSGIGLCKSVSQVHRGRYYVSVKRGGEDVKRDISVAIERIFQADTLKVVLWDEEEPTFLCVVRITRSDYDELKKQQGLLIDFDNFPAQLVRLLQQCAASNMFLILQQNDPKQYFLEFVEHNEFKKLVHLSLRTTPATDSDVKSHMAETITNLKKSLTAAKNSASSSEVAWSEKCLLLEKKIQELNLSLARIEEDRRRRETEHQEQLRIERDRLNQERLECQRNAEMSSKTHATSLQETVARKDKQLEEVNQRCRQLKDNINSLEAQLSEKNQRLCLLEKEVQKSHIEAATLRAKNAALEREVLDKERLIQNEQAKYNDLERIMRDTNEQVKTLTATVQALQREKSSLEQKLTISESLVNKNNEAVQCTSEQLMKANEIISKQNSDLVEIKEKLICRTAIVLEQEKEIESSAKEIDKLKKSEEELRTECTLLRTERGDLSSKVEALEKSLREREENLKSNNLVIQWLHKKMDQLSPHSDRPWESDRRHDKDSVESLRLNIDEGCHSARSTRDSARSDTRRSGKSLDPRYLRPADDDRQTRRTVRGKENVLTNLPRVDYDPKKSSRSVITITPATAFRR